jgi:hypothetical protein
MRGHGNTFDVAVGINPVADLAAGANTGKRIHMRNYDTLGVLFFKNAASAGTDTVTLTLQEHSANTGGTSQNLAAITDWYYKSTAAALAGTEPWTEVTQAAAATLALADAGAVKAANQAMVLFEIESGALSAGFEWLSVNIGDPGAGGTILGGLFYIPTGLKISLRPDRLAQPNA